MNVNKCISLTMQHPNLKLDICFTNIVVEGTVSQTFDGGPGGPFYKRIFEKKEENVSCFLTKQKLRPKLEI